MYTRLPRWMVSALVVCTHATVCQVCVKPSCMMRWHGGGKLTHPSPIWERRLQFVFVSRLLGGHPRFIHYLKSCRNSVWDLKHDSAFLHLRKKREWELREVYFNEVCVCLTSSLFFQIQLRLHMKASQRENQTAWPATPVLWEPPKRAQRECFQAETGRFECKLQEICL